MQVAVTSLVSLYEIDRLSPSEIAESEGLDVTTVKVFLSKHSAQYRADCGQAAQLKIGLELNGSEAGTQHSSQLIDVKQDNITSDTRLTQFEERGLVGIDKKAGDKLGFSPEEGEEIKQVILNIARNNESPPAVRLNAATFVFNEIKGRNDVKNMADAAGMGNLFAFQEALLKQRSILDKVRAAKQVSNQKIVEVASV